MLDGVWKSWGGSGVAVGLPTSYVNIDLQLVRMARASNFVIFENELGTGFVIGFQLNMLHRSRGAVKCVFSAFSVRKKIWSYKP